MPQTLTEIRAMLDAAGLRPQKMFGQNFLIDHNLLREVVDLAGVAPGDAVLEVGPGTGTLTDVLLDAGACVVAVEIDHGLARLLESRYAGRANLQLIHADVLASKHAINPQVLTALRQLGAPAVHLVSNLPYNIATPLICDCLLQSVAAERGDADAILFSDLTVTIQWEAAQRLSAEAGGGLYGPASVLAALLSTIRLGKRLPPEAFWPRPQVISQMVRIDFTPPDRQQLPDVGVLTSLLALAFSQRRKKIASAAKRRGSAFTPDVLAAALDAAGVDPAVRPEGVTPEQYARMAATLAAS